MPGATTRLALPYPLSTESPAGHTQIQNLATAIDGAAIDLAEGTLAARPAPSIRGRWYYATDVATLYRDSGATWRAVMGTDVVTAAMIAPDAVGTSELAADAVGNSELAPDAVTNTEVAAGAAIAKSKLASLNIVDADVNAAAAIAEAKLALASDAAAGTPSRRTLGSGATQAAAGNDTRFPAGVDIVDADIGAAAAIALSKLAIRPMTRVFHNADQAIAAASGVVIFNSERYDTDAIHDTVTNASRLTCKTAGVYRIFFNGTYFSTNLNSGVEYWLRVNGSTVIAKQKEKQTVNVSTGDPLPPLVAEYLLAVNDFVEVVVDPLDANAGTIVASGNSSPEFGMSLVSRAS